MSTSSPAGFSRRRLLAGATGLALLAAGCTSGGQDDAAAETAAQDDRVAAQVPVQESVVAAYDAAAVADPALGGRVAPLAEQARSQLERLREAVPDATSSASSPAAAPPPGADVLGWLRGQVAAAATSHATACVDAAGARAALLGSMAAGLRGHEAALA